MKIRLAHKFILALLAIGGAALLIAAPLLQREVKTDWMKRIGEEMAAGAKIIALMPPSEIASKSGELAKSAGARLTLIDAAGRVIADSQRGAERLNDHLHRSEIQEARLRGVGKAIRYSHTLKKEMLYVAVPVVGGATTGYVRLSRPLAEINRTIDERWKGLLTFLLLTIIAVLLPVLLFSVRLLSPIARLVEFTGKARTGSISGTRRSESGDEISQLSKNIRDVMSSLQGKIRAADAERRKLESLFSGMSEGVMLLDAENRIASVNRGMEEMMARPREEVIGKTPLEVFRNIKLHGALERFREKREMMRSEVCLGGDRPVMTDVTISAVRGEDARDRETLLVFHDVTHLKRLERIRTDFVANVTHEIRTPLTAIIGFTETLQQGAVDDPPTARTFLQTIRENAERLNRLVDDLLTLSGLELGEVKLHREEVRIDEALERTLAVFDPRIKEKGVTIRKTWKVRQPLIRADRDRLAQILINILDNAIKFTPAGGTIEIATIPGDDGELIVQMADTGIGIPKSELSRLGERFYRADRTRSREMGGTGLGLSIVKHLMKAHGGRMVIESTPNRGTTVSLFFPLIPESR